MTPDDLVRMLQDGAGVFTDGEPVDELEHALQCANLAQSDPADAELIVAAAIHDIGYHCSVVEAFPGLPHEIAGARFAAQHFSERVSWLIAQHVRAKCYLVAADALYAKGLSQASLRSLARQGGPMSADEIAAFVAHPWATDAARLRLWDDAAKTPGATQIALEDLSAVVAQTLQSGTSTAAMTQSA